MRENKKARAAGLFISCVSRPRVDPNLTGSSRNRLAIHFDRAHTDISAITVAAASHQISEAHDVHLGEIHLSALQPDSARRREFPFEDVGFGTIAWLSLTRPERHHLVDIQPDPALLRDSVFKRMPFELIAAI